MRKALWNPLSTLLRTVRPARASSFNRSKYTMYESTVIPTETISPMMPARSMVVFSDWPMKAMVAHSSEAVTASPDTTTMPSRR